MGIILKGFALVIVIVLILTVIVGVENNTHDENMAREQTNTTLAQSIGEIAEALEAMAIALKEQSIANQMLSTSLDKQNELHYDYINKQLNIIFFIILLLVVFIVAVSIMLVHFIKKHYFH